MPMQMLGPFSASDTGGRVMYYMIHATDHPEAPKFMSRAYRRAVLPLEPIEQLSLALFSECDEETVDVWNSNEVHSDSSAH